MVTKPKILAFAGSTRSNSFNKQLVRIAAESARDAGAEVTVADLRDFPMPLYDADLEAKEGIPAFAVKFKKLMTDHQGFLISAPEYNSSISAVLKNTIDWASRQLPDEKPLACFAGKVAVIMSASPGNLGGLRGLVTVRSILENLQVLVLPDQVAIPKADGAFQAEASLKDKAQQESVEKLGQNLVRILQKLQ